MKKSISIGRHYGSGGFNIGRRLAKELEYEFYDKELVELAAKKANFDPNAVKHIDESAKGSFLYSIAMGNYTVGTLGGPVYYDLPINDKLYIAQSEVITECAKKSPCVFVGRCADYVLKNENIDVLSVFIYADMDYKIKNVMKKDGLTKQQAKDRINKTEKQRRSYYDYYTSNDWGIMSNYDICLNAGVLGEDACVEILKSLILK